MAQSKTKTRYGIGEWYGRGFHTMSSSERRVAARQELAANGLTGKPCPFRPNMACNKKGGVCSLRLYEQVGELTTSGVQSPVATCPNRFLESRMIHRWVGETLLETASPIVLSEIGFLNRLSANGRLDEESDSDHIGRIDSVLLHPDRVPIDWCALEIQAVYFSGDSMSTEFRLLSKESTTHLPFPAARRRPDWRSSGPKRLLPQLQTKTPTIRTWGKKIAVVVDEPFFGSLVGLEQEKHLSNAEIVWFVVGYEPKANGWTLVPRKAVFTKLESSVRALTGGTPLSREAFESQLKRKLHAVDPQHAVFKDEK